MPSRRLRDLLGREPVDLGRVREREVPLDRLHLARRAIELARDRDVERPAAPVEHARKLAVEPGRDGDRRAIVADRDRDEPAGRLVSSCRSLERAQQGERLEVDPDDLQAGAPARLQVAIDDLAVGDDEEDALPGRAVLALALVEDDVVEHGLVERDRKNLLGAEADRVLELLLVRDAVDLEDAHADPVVRDTEPNAALRKLVELEEALERVAQRIRVADLAGDDEAGLERLAERVDQLGSAVVDDLCGCDLGGADLEADELLRALLLPLLRGALLASPSAPSRRGGRIGAARRSTSSSSSAKIDRAGSA